MILCFSLFLLPFCFFESFLCSHLSLSKAFLKYSGLSMTLPSDNVKKCFRPKSNPSELLAEIFLSSMIGFDCSVVWTMKLMKYCPEGFLDTVAVFCILKTTCQFPSKRSHWIISSSIELGTFTTSIDSNDGSFSDVKKNHILFPKMIFRYFLQADSSLQPKL